ncbi:hypothetical protein [Rubellicoccus peritrichatus]|uniref:Uncharacterized protein n=1 Tax=Rubellicoccus peritrichatus TaxID=3080537 RepID=A0AAQ3L9K5_9BACT|nr:hypothetical protein [Puniceicoccus sp. CR14]WOO39835.1 hypothetical protein RZN69_14515 [Puniceicoccus sp. CR14]
MIFYTTDRDGITEINPSERKLREILRSLDEDRSEHGEVWLTHTESNWQATVFSNGTIHLENETLHEPTRELRGTGFAKALEIWEMLSRGNTEAILKQPWNLLDE